MPNQDLLNFIKQSKSAGQTDEQIKSVLRQNGWQEPVIEEGFNSLSAPPQPEAPKPKPPLPTVSTLSAAKPEQNYSDILYGPRLSKRIDDQKARARRRLIIIAIVSMLLAALGTALYFYKDELKEIF